MAADQIHVFIGTKAQYIKTAPLLRLMDEQEIPYRLIDSGQHAEIAGVMRSELNVREPDYSLGGKRDVATIGAAVAWSLALASKLWSGRRIRQEIFGGRGGICVVHGDTPSTLLSSLLAWRAGLRVAHLEAGLRSGSLWHPFPEEIIRIVVMRFADILFAPTQDARDNLAKTRTRGVVVSLPGNTSIEAVSYADVGDERGVGPAVVTMHRVENLKNPQRVSGWVEVVLRIAERGPVVFVMHEPTRLVLEKSDALDRLKAAGVEITELIGHQEFVRMLAAAPLVVIDGGSIQEECGYLGVPTLLWREKTERLHGLGRNVVLSEFDPEVVDAFLANPEAVRQDPQLPDVQPSVEILDALSVHL